jgi:hypothetical protein
MLDVTRDHIRFLTNRTVTRSEFFPFHELADFLDLFTVDCFFADAQLESVVFGRIVAGRDHHA